MGESATASIIKPADCALGLGVPTTRGGFLSDLGRSDADFAKRFRFWGRYQKEVAQPLAKRGRQLEALGVAVVPRLTLDTFGGLVRGAYKVIVLFAHWRDDSVELRDGFASPEAIVGQIPTTSRCILDLCVCHPRELVHVLRRRRPGNMVRFTLAPSTPTLWLAFYYALMSLLHQEDLTYLQGLEKTLENFGRKPS